jgi:hypothetical protein
MKILRPEVEACIVETADFFEFMDNLILTLFNITNDEYDYIIANATDEDLQVFVAALGTDEKASTFTQRRLSLELRNRMLVEFNKTKG